VVEGAQSLPAKSFWPDKMTIDGGVALVVSFREVALGALDGWRVASQGRSGKRVMLIAWSPQSVMASPNDVYPQ